MTTTRDFERRLGDWLEDGPQTVPDWLVEQALDQAHASRQVGAGLRWPLARGTGGARGERGGPSFSLAFGAIGALAVVTAFGLGILFGPWVGDDEPTRTPAPGVTASPTPPGSVVPEPVGGLDFIDVLPGESPDFASLVGITATPGAVWTAVVTGDGARLVRIDAVTGVATPLAIPGAAGILSPPWGDGGDAWTGSAAGLHRVDGGGLGEPVTLPLGFVPAEIEASTEGLWVARDGGITLVDRATGQALRQLVSSPGSVTGRIIGAPALGSLWACTDGRTLARLDPLDGGLLGTTALAAGGCRGRVVTVRGVDGLADGVVPVAASVVVDPSGGVSARFDVGQWSDVTAVAGRLWFLDVVPEPPGANLALVELDPGSGRPSRILTFQGEPHLAVTFESPSLAVAAGFLWIMVDPTPDDGPQIIRIPLSALR